MASASAGPTRADWCQQINQLGTVRDDCAVCVCAPNFTPMMSIANNSTNSYKKRLQANLEFQARQPTSGSPVSPALIECLPYENHPGRRGLRTRRSHPTWGVELGAIRYKRPGIFDVSGGHAQGRLLPPADLTTSLAHQSSDPSSRLPSSLCSSDPDVTVVPLSLAQYDAPAGRKGGDVPRDQQPDEAKRRVREQDLDEECDPGDGPRINCRP